MRLAAFILLILGTGCRSNAEKPLPRLQLSADAAENSYLTGIFFGRNEDSIVNCALSDYNKNKYYIFMTSMPGDEKFEKYLAVYAKNKYKLIIVSCGCRGRAGAYYYNHKMATLFSKTKPEPLGLIYLEAKSLYNRALPVYLVHPELSVVVRNDK
jgi:hypothetical protein